MKDKDQVYDVETGREKWRVIASSPRDAATKAFKSRAPRAPGILTSVVGKNGIVWYVESADVLRRAGYDVDVAP